MPQTLDSINQACRDDVSHDGFVDMERPIGRKAENAKRKRKENEKEDVMEFMKKKTKFLENGLEVEKEFICIKEKKVCLEELRMMEKINIEKERLHFEQVKEDGRMRGEDEKMHREDKKKKKKKKSVNKMKGFILRE